MPIGLNEIVDRGLNTALTRRLGLGPDATVSLMPELAAVLPIGSQPEMDFHMGWRKYIASFAIGAGGAATFGTLQFRMPRGANVLALIESVWFDGGGSIRGSGIIGTTDLATVLGAQGRDTIQPATKPGVCVLSVGTPADAGFGGGLVYSSASNFMPPAFPLVVRPSLIAGTALDGYTFQVATANTAVAVCVAYRERMLNDQENVL